MSLEALNLIETKKVQPPLQAGISIVEIFIKNVSPSNFIIYQCLRRIGLKDKPALSVRFFHLEFSFKLEHVVNAISKGQKEQKNFKVSSFLFYSTRKAQKLDRIGWRAKGGGHFWIF